MLTVILTGGQSRRMGRDKATLPWMGDTLYEALAKRYSADLGDVLLSVSPELSVNTAYSTSVVDTFPGKGPLNGLYSAFTHTNAGTVLLTATDMPFGSTSLANHLESELGEHDACVIRRKDGLTEPLFAVYSRKCFGAVKAALEQDRRSLVGLLSEINTAYIDERELSAWDLDNILYNVNTPTDYGYITESFKAAGDEPAPPAGSSFRCF